MPPTNLPRHVSTLIQSSWYRQDDYSDHEGRVTNHSSNQPESISGLDESTTDTLDTMELSAKLFAHVPSSSPHTTQSLNAPSTDNKEHHESPTSGSPATMVSGQAGDDTIDRVIYEILQIPITATSATFKGLDGWDGLPLRVEVEMNAYKEGKYSTRDVRTEFLPRSLCVTSSAKAKQEDVVEQSCSTPTLEEIEAEIGQPVVEDPLHYDDSCMSVLSSPGHSYGSARILATPDSGRQQTQIVHAAEINSMVASLHQVDSQAPPSSLQPPDKPLPPLPNPTYQERSYLGEPKERRRSLLFRQKDMQRYSGYSAGRSTTGLRLHTGLSRSKTSVKGLTSPSQSPATTSLPEEDESQANTHPLLRTPPLRHEISDDTLGPLLSSLQTPYHHRRNLSASSSQLPYSPSQPHSNPPSVYLNSPTFSNSSPIQPQVVDPQSPSLSATFVDETPRRTHSPSLADPFITSGQSNDSPPRFITIGGIPTLRPTRENSRDYARAIEDCSGLYRIGTGKSSDELLRHGSALSPGQQSQTNERIVRAAARGALQRLSGEQTFPWKRRNSLLLRESSCRRLPSLPDDAITPASAADDNDDQISPAPPATPLPEFLLVPDGPLTVRDREEKALEARLASPSPSPSQSSVREKEGKEGKEGNKAVDRQHGSLVRELLG
ncbi:MAG: hypothetical protein Q9187_002433, partial [Circinaria calcarea]